jgi:FKBP-type peptidyl-prolyl cis-trans isomerase
MFRTSHRHRDPSLLMNLRRYATVLLPLAFTACLEGTDYTTNPYPEVPIESTTFAASLNVNLAQSTKTSTGLYYRDLTVGTGTTAAAGNIVSTYFTLYLVDGTKAGEIISPSTPFSFTIGANPPTVIKGWDEGLRGMKVGGSRQLIIPPALAYGSAGSGPVPPNAVIVYTVQLVGVQ